MKGDLVNGGADVFAAKNDVVYQDSEVTSSLRMLGLLVQYMTSDGHQISPIMCFSYMIHLICLY